MLLENRHIDFANKKDPQIRRRRIKRKPPPCANPLEADPNLPKCSIPT
jgi:hypothetical protein